MKNKETLEEAAYEYVKNFAMSVKSARQIGFIAGAKWQQERSYSEEEMIEFSEWVSINFPNQHDYLRALQKHNQGLYVPEEKLKGYRTTKELFEQFKKK